MRYPLSEKLRSSGWLSDPICRQAHAGAVGHSPHLVLSLVRPLSDRRTGGPGGPPLAAWPSLEPYPDEVRDRIVQLALDETDLSPRELAVPVHRHRGLLCIGILGLSTAQGP